MTNKPTSPEYEAATADLNQALLDERDARQLLGSASRRVKASREKVSRLYDEWMNGSDK